MNRRELVMGAAAMSLVGVIPTAAIASTPTRTPTFDFHSRRTMVTWSQAGMECIMYYVGSFEPTENETYFIFDTFCVKDDGVRYFNHHLFERNALIEQFSTDEEVLNHIARQEQSTIASSSVGEDYVGEAPQWFIGDTYGIDVVRYSWTRPRGSKYVFVAQIEVCHDNRAIYKVLVSDAETNDLRRTAFFVCDLTYDELTEDNVYEYFHRQFDPFMARVTDSIENPTYE